MTGFEATKLPRDVGEMGEAMCVHKHFYGSDQWQATRRLDTPPERHPARLLASSSPLHPGSRCFDGVHGEVVHTGAAVRLLDCRMARWGTSRTVL